MKKIVLVSIKGLSYTLDSDGDSGVETLTRGQYYNRNNSEFVTFEESIDGECAIKSRIKFADTFLDLNRKGAYNVHMYFEEGKKNYTDYKTPFGNFVIGIDTTNIDIERNEKGINMCVEYDMELNYEFVGKCRIDLALTNVLE